MIGPIILLVAAGAAIWAFSRDRAKELPQGEISVYTLSNGSTVNVPFNELISVPGVGPALPEQFPPGLWERWMAFANAPDSFTAENALTLEYDLAAAGAWYEASYVSSALML